MRSLRTKNPQRPPHSRNRRRKTNRMRRMLQTRENRYSGRVHAQTEATRQTVRSHSSHADTEKEDRNQSGDNSGNHRRLHFKDTPSPRETRLNPQRTRQENQRENLSYRKTRNRQN